MLTKFAAVLAVAASLASAQTHTVCNPLKKDCPNPKAVGSKPVTVDFTKGKNPFFTELEGTTLKYDNALGAVFTIDMPMQAPTVESEQTIFFGKVDVVVRAAEGAGIVTSLVLQSLDLDEIDWEFVGNDEKQVQANYFSKGCDTVYNRGSFHPVANPQAEFHTYTINWTPKKLEWIINGAVVRTLVNEGLEGCSGYPQTPMQIKLGTWVGGRADKPPGVIEWAGGLANFDKPHNGYYQKVTITDYMGGDGTPGSGASEATEYAYTDRSGDAGSIKVIGGDGSNNGGDKTTTSSSSTKSSTKTSASTLTTVTSSSSSSAPSGTESSSPSGSETSSAPSGTGSGSGPSQTGGNAPAQSSTVPSGGEKLALPLGMGLAALIAALL